MPGNGLPIVLLADRQTTGGYPKIATVISADMPALGRLMPGAKVAFKAVDIAAAEAAHRQHRADIDAIADSIVGVRAAIDAAKLLEFEPGQRHDRCVRLAAGRCLIIEQRA